MSDATLSDAPMFSEADYWTRLIESCQLESLGADDLKALIIIRSVAGHADCSHVKRGNSNAPALVHDVRKSLLAGLSFERFSAGCETLRRLGLVRIEQVTDGVFAIRLAERQPGAASKMNIGE